MIFILWSIGDLVVRIGDLWPAADYRSWLKNVIGKAQKKPGQSIDQSGGGSAKLGDNLQARDPVGQQTGPDEQPVSKSAVNDGRHC